MHNYYRIAVPENLNFQYSSQQVALRSSRVLLILMKDDQHVIKRSLGKRELELLVIIPTLTLTFVNSKFLLYFLLASTLPPTQNHFLK